MGYRISMKDKEQLFDILTKQYDVFAPMVMKGEGCFSDTDVVRYGKIQKAEDIEWQKKSDYSFKEVLLPINETIFYFTEDQVSVPKIEAKKKIVFLRSCDLHAVKRLDQIYLNNGPEDFYYKRHRDQVKFCLMECPTSCDSGFCASMGTNVPECYDFSLRMTNAGIFMDCNDEEIKAALSIIEKEEMNVSPEFITENPEKVTLPKNLSNESFTDDIWKEYGSRCIACGRCNFVCPTCTCFTMQDVFYQDNKNVGERRRIWASCQVDGYTEMAGGIEFRKPQADRVRFKVMHKIYDYEKRFGYPMCVGCGRCDDVCPEYISYSNLVNRLAKKEAE